MGQLVAVNKPAIDITVRHLPSSGRTPKRHYTAKFALLLGRHCRLCRILI